MKLWRIKYYDPANGIRAMWCADGRKVRGLQQELYDSGCGGFESESLFVPPTKEALVEFLNRMEAQSDRH